MGNATTFDLSALDTDATPDQSAALSPMVGPDGPMVATHGGVKLAVVERAGKPALAVEREQTATDPDPADKSKRIKRMDAAGKPVKVKVWKVSGDLADFARAVKSGLIRVG